MSKVARFFGVCGLVVTGTMLSACATAAFLDTAAHGIFTQEHVNFTERNYAVADYLVGQIKTYVGRNDLVVAMPLKDRDHPEMASDLSKMIPEQVGVRFSQLGYRMDLEPVLTSPDTNYFKPADSERKTPDFILSGTFLRHRTEMDVSMRIMDAKTSRVVAAFDYVLPLSREVDDMSRPQPKIMRMTSP